MRLLFLFIVLFFSACKSKAGVYLDKNGTNKLKYFYIEFLGAPSPKLFEDLIEQEPTMESENKLFYNLIYGEKEDGSWEIEGKKDEIYKKFLSLSLNCGKVKTYKILESRYVKDGATGTEVIFFETEVIWQKCKTLDFVSLGFAIDDKRFPPRLNLYAYSSKQIKN